MPRYPKGTKFIKPKPGFELSKETGQYITVMQSNFIAAYCDNKKPETYMQARKAMESAGYKNVSDSDIAKLMTNVTVRNAMNLWLEKNGRTVEITRQRVLQMLLDQYDKADISEDRSNAIRAAELLGKSIAMFGDRLTITTEQQTRIDETLKKEAYALSQKRMSEIIDTECLVIENNPKVQDSLPFAPEPTPENDEQGDLLPRGDENGENFVPMAGSQ